MTKARIVILLVIAALSMGLFSSFASAQQGVTVITGFVTVDGVPASQGTPVEVKLDNGTVIGSTTTGSIVGMAANQYRMDIQSKDVPVGQNVTVGVPGRAGGSTVTFQVNRRMDIDVAVSTATATPMPTATPLPTATPVPEPSNFLRTLEKVPASFLDDDIWFSHPERSLEIAGLESIRDLEEYSSMTDEEGDAYFLAREAGIAFPRGLFAANSAGDIWQETFLLGWDLSFHRGRGISATTYIEGEFDAEAFKAELIKVGYEEREAHGYQYFLLREFGADFEFPIDYLTMFDFNQIYVGDGTLAVSHNTEHMEEILATFVAEGPSVAEDESISALAKSLGHPLSAAIFPRSLTEQGTVGPNGVALEKSEGWGNLHKWDYAAIGYGKESDEDRWHRFSLLYSDPEAAEADAQELLSRMENYNTTLSEEMIEQRRGGPEVRRPLQYCESLKPSYTSGAEFSILTMECSFSKLDPSVRWKQLIKLRDLAFLVP